MSEPLKFDSLAGERLRFSTQPLRRAGDQVLARVGAALGSAFLIGDPKIGLLLWLAVTAGHVRGLIFGLFGLWVGDVIGRLIGVLDKPALGGGVRANAILAAIAVAWLTSGAYLPVETEIALTTLAASAAALITAALMRSLAGALFPPMVLGFSLVAGTLFTLFPVWVASASSTLLVWPAPSGIWPDAQIFIRSLGSLVFSPTLEVGAIIGLAVLLWSRVIFFTGFAGWLAGALTAIELQGLSVPFYWQPASYNFFIAGMALGAAYFLPGWPSLGLAAAGGSAAAVLAALIQHVQPDWAFLPLSAIGIIWIFLAAFTLSGGADLPRRNTRHDMPPERVWMYEVDRTRRFGHQEPLLVVPLAGLVQITQGFDGRLSHTGEWRHALDFQRPPDGTIWEAPVTAPAAGTIERVRDDVPDNQLGVCNYAESWGNYVLLRMEQGGWALLAHLKQASVAVTAGARVELGAYLGQVGNSGRSPVPHLHLQVQNSPRLGAPTSPFRLANYEAQTTQGGPCILWREAGVPREQSLLAASRPEAPSYWLLTSLAPGLGVWTVEMTGEMPRRFRQPRERGKIEHITTRMDAEGQHILASSRGDELVLHLDPDAWRIREIHRLHTPLLRLLALAVPSIPYAARNLLEWREPALALACTAGGFSLSLWPYWRLPLPEMRCLCLEAPETGTGLLVVESTPVRPSIWLPSKITCSFQRLRGPVKVEAVFETGSIICTQLSFEPGLPF